MGQRVRNVMAELHGEKIDIVDWSDDPAELRRARAVAGRGSARWRSSTPAARSARVVVPDFQLSLAIGKEGQNARLAARLTGWRIDIRSDEAPRPVLTARCRAGWVSVARHGRVVRSGSRTRLRSCPDDRPARGRSGPASDAASGPRRRELLRVVAGSDPTASRPSCPIRTATATGRGAHLHPTTECYELAVRRKAFPRALRFPSGSGVALSTHTARPSISTSTSTHQHRTHIGRDRPTETGAAAHEHSMSTSQ